MDTQEIERIAGARRRGTTVDALLAVISGAAGSALLRWSIWWPHADNRQRWATYILIAASLITLWTLTRSLVARPPRIKVAVLVAWAVAVAVGATLGFGWLRSATLPYR